MQNFRLIKRGDQSVESGDIARRLRLSGLGLSGRRCDCWRLRKKRLRILLRWVGLWNDFLFLVRLSSVKKPLCFLWRWLGLIGGSGDRSW